jgi:hypothetical protein
MTVSARVKIVSTAMPSSRMTIMTAMAAGMSDWSWSVESRTPIDGCPRMITSSSPAMRLRQANAQPCLRPATKEGSEAGRIRCRYIAMRPSPMARPALSRSGGV